MMLYLYIVSCLLALGHAWYHRHSIADTRGGLLLACIVACVPVVNVTLVVAFWYFAYFNEPVLAWLKKPLKP